MTEGGLARAGAAPRLVAVRAPPHTMQGTSKALRTRGNCRGTSVSPQSAGLRQARGTAVILRHRQVVGAHRSLDWCMPQVTAVAPPMAVVCPIRPRQWLRGKAFGTVGHAGQASRMAAVATPRPSLPSPLSRGRCPARRRRVGAVPGRYARRQQRPDPHPPSHPGAVAAASRAAAPPRRGWQRVDSDRAQAVSCPERTPTTAAQPPHLAYRHER